jgi:two-component system nitrogen regulation response regulator GlnG
LQHQLAQLNRDLDRDVKGIAPDALERLLNYSWPGNVRELQGVLKQAILETTGPVLLAAALPEEVQPRRTTSADRAPRPAVARDSFDVFIHEQLKDEPDNLYSLALERMERQLLSAVLEHAQGNQSEASRILGITRGSLRNKIRTLGISIEQVISVDSE